MQYIILSDPAAIRAELLPMTYVRPICELRLGITVLREKWQALIPGSYSWDTAEYLSAKFPLDNEATRCADTLYIAGNVIPDARLAQAINELPVGTSLVDAEGAEIARRGFAMAQDSLTYDSPVKALTKLYDIFLMNHEAIKADFAALDAADGAAPDASVTVIGPRENLYIAPDAKVQGCVLNVTNGPIYVGAGAEVMEGSCLRGPIAICPNATVKMGAKMYGGTTIGPFCKVGGELNNVVMQAYSNKAHDGFLGNAVVGEWCNLGAGCTASNLKNDYTEIKLWNYPAHRFLRTGLQFCGLIMGDYSKTGVNTMLNTATVLGVGVNIHGSGFPRPFLASFSEGSTAGYSDVPMQKFFDTAAKMMARRGLELTRTDIDILNNVRRMAEQYR